MIMGHYLLLPPSTVPHSISSAVRNDSGVTSARSRREFLVGPFSVADRWCGILSTIALTPIPGLDRWRWVEMVWLDLTPTRDVAPHVLSRIPRNALARRAFCTRRPRLVMRQHMLWTLYPEATVWTLPPQHNGTRTYSVWGQAISPFLAPSSAAPPSPPSSA
jgi:hypothetical protein